MSPSLPRGRLTSSPEQVLDVNRQAQHFTASIPVASSRALRPHSTAWDGDATSSKSSGSSQSSSIRQSGPTMQSVGTLTTDLRTTSSTGPAKISETRAELERINRSSSALAIYRATPTTLGAQTTRSASARRANQAGNRLKPRPASALGHPTYFSISGATPIPRGESLTSPTSKDSPHKRSTREAPPRQRRVQNDGGRPFRPSSTPLPGGLTIRHALTPVPDDFDLDGIGDTRSSAPLRRQSVRIASFISRFGHDAARRLTRSPTPSPLSLVPKMQEDGPSGISPETHLRSAVRHHDSFGVTDDGSDAGSLHQLYHDGHRRRRNSAGSIVEVSVRSLLYAENPDYHSHSDHENDDTVLSVVPKPLDALDLLCLVPQLAFDPQSSGRELTCSGPDSSPSSPPYLSRSSSQWTPASDSTSMLPTSPCSTLPDTTERAETLLLAASQVLSAHAATLLHHADKMSDASTTLRALASESLEWGSRLMAAVSGSVDSLNLSPPSRTMTRSPSQIQSDSGSSGGVAHTDRLPVVANSPSRIPRRSMEPRSPPSQRSTRRRNSFALQPIAHSNLLAEAERLASEGWINLHAADRSHSRALAEMRSASRSDDDASREGTVESYTASTLFDSHSPTSEVSVFGHPHSFSSASLQPQEGSSDNSTISRDSASSDNEPNRVDETLQRRHAPIGLQPAIKLSPATAGASPHTLATRDPPVSEHSWNDSTTEVLIASPDAINEQGSLFPNPDSTLSVPIDSPSSTLSSDSYSRTSNEAQILCRPTPCFQVDDFGILHAPFPTKVNQRPPRGVSFDDTSDGSVPLADGCLCKLARVSSKVPPASYVPPAPPKTDDVPRLSAPSRLKRRLSSRSRARDEPDRSGAVTPSRRTWFFRWSGPLRPVGQASESG